MLICALCTDMYSPWHKSFLRANVQTGHVLPAAAMQVDPPTVYRQQLLGVSVLIVQLFAAVIEDFLLHA